MIKHITKIKDQRQVSGINSNEIKQFIHDHGNLFWWIREADKENISIHLLVETILNYGDIPDIKRLFELVGIDRVASIFHDQVYRTRINYSQRTVHYFKHYFKNHVQSNNE